MLVDHVSLAGTAGDGNATGLRIKSDIDRGGLVEDVTYRNLCIQNVLHPITFDPFYDTSSGSEIPQFSNIVIRNAHVLTEGKVQLQGYDSARPPLPSTMSSSTP